MAKTRYLSKLASYLILERVGKNGKPEILLQLRQNTGYMDGFYDFACSGHVEKDETFSAAIIREAKEEIDITIQESDLQFALISHRPDAGYVDCFFKANRYTGMPTAAEPDKCANLLWASYDNLPDNLIPYLRRILTSAKHGTKFIEEPAGAESQKSK